MTTPRHARLAYANPIIYTGSHEYRREHLRLAKLEADLNQALQRTVDQYAEQNIDLIFQPPLKGGDYKLEDV